MTEFLQMAGLAVTGGILLIFLREKTPSIGFSLSIALTLVLITGHVLPKLTMASDGVKSLFLGDMPLFSLLLRGIGISYITQITSQLLSGAGEESAAKTVVMAGNCSLACLALEPAAHILRAAEALLS